HADPCCGIETVGRLIVPNGTKLRSKLVLAEYAKTKVLVERRVPRNVREGGERDGRQATLRRPNADAFKQRSTDAGSLMLRPDADLLDVSAPTDGVDEYVSDGHIHLVDGDPGPPGLRVAGERLHRGGLVVRDLR